MQKRILLKNAISYFLNNYSKIDEVYKNQYSHFFYIIVFFKKMNFFLAIILKNSG